MLKPHYQITFNQSIFNEFETKPIEGYSEHVNEQTGEKLPYCCERHNMLYEELQAVCKEPLFAHLPDKVIRQSSFTEYHVIKQIEKVDWYKDITDFIEWNYLSFGDIVYGQRLYIHIIKYFIKEQVTAIPDEKRKLLRGYLDNYFNPSIKAPEEYDFNIETIYTTYKNWLSLFPFELTSYFGNLKQLFENQWPMIKVVYERNKYINVSQVKFHTKESLLEALLNLTNELLTKINGVLLYEKGLINNTEKTTLELIITSRKLKLKQGYLNDSPVEDERFIQIIEAWLRDEERFFDQITPLLRTLPIPRPETKNKKLSIKQIALIHAYEGCQITRKNAAAIAEQYGFTSPNSGEGLFQDYNYYSITQNRKGKPHPCTSKKFKNKIELLESVTEHLNDEAKQRALLEISMLKKLFEKEDE